MVSSDFDLDVYLARTGAPPDASLAALHRAHLSAIPFENLDPHRGVPVALDLAALQAKLIHRRRGGYCFEQNLLLKAALEALGYRVQLHLARVRWNMPADAALSRTHLVLAIDDGATTWVGDVGFGPGSLLEPVPFEPGEAVEQSGWRLRVVEEDSQLVLRTVLGAVWRDVYAIDPLAVPLIDAEISNWYVCTHPDSRFVRGLSVGIVMLDGSQLTLRSGDELELVHRTPTTSARRTVSADEVPGLLASRFGLPGFSVGADGRIRLADTPTVTGD